MKKKSRGNGTGTAYKLPSGKWRCECTLGYRPDGRRVYRTKSGFKTKREALEYIPKLRASTTTSKKIKLADVYETWSARHYEGLSKGRVDEYKRAWRRFDELHYVPVDEIRTRDLQQCIDAVNGGFHVKIPMRNLASMIFDECMVNDIVQKNYAQFLKIPTKPESTRDAFTVAEIDAFWEDYKAGNDFTGYILILLYTGMRLGELEQLKKENIHLQDRYMVGGIKTEAGKDRTIPIAEKVFPIVAKFFMANEVGIIKMSRRIFYKKYYAAIERAGVRKLPPHSCRHAFATRMNEENINSGVAKEMMGHSDYGMTLKYTHVSTSEKIKAANRL